MKTIRFAGIVLFLGVSANAAAVCPIISDPLATRVTNLTGLLNGNTVCVGSGSSWQAQEYHEVGTNKLIDYKHGPKVPKTMPEQPGLGGWNDWTDQVGNWALSNDGTNSATVDYDYDRNGAYEYSNAVYEKSGQYYFCTNNTDQTNISNIKIGGPAACP